MRLLFLLLTLLLKTDKHHLNDSRRPSLIVDTNIKGISSQPDWVLFNEIPNLPTGSINGNIMIHPWRTSTKFLSLPWVSLDRHPLLTTRSNPSLNCLPTFLCDEDFSYSAPVLPIGMPSQIERWCMESTSINSWPHPDFPCHKGQLKLQHVYNYRFCNCIKCECYPCAMMAQRNLHDNQGNSLCDTHLYCRFTNHSRAKDKSRVSKGFL